MVLREMNGRLKREREKNEVNAEGSAKRGRGRKELRIGGAVRNEIGRKLGKNKEMVIYDTFSRRSVRVVNKEVCNCEES